MGIVTELGEGVTLLKKGDRVVMPFNVADGRCRNCEEGKTAFCTGVNPGFAGGAYGKPTPYDFEFDRRNTNCVQDMLRWVLIAEVRDSSYMNESEPWAKSVSRPSPVYTGSIRRLQCVEAPTRHRV